MDLKGNEINSSQSKEFYGKRILGNRSTYTGIRWQHIMNFKRDYKGLRKSSLFFLTTSGTAELNQSETRFPLGLQEIQHMLELQYLCSFHKN